MYAVCYLLAYGIHIIAVNVSLPVEAKGVPMTDTSVMQKRIGQLCYQFKLPTMGAQSLARFTGYAHSDAPPTFLDILQQKAEDPGDRRINWLRKDSGSPRVRPGRLSNTTGCPWPSGSSWTNWPRRVLSIGASTSWPSDSPAPARLTPCAPWDTG